MKLALALLLLPAALAGCVATDDRAEPVVPDEAAAEAAPFRFATNVSGPVSLRFTFALGGAGECRFEVTLAEGGGSNGAHNAFRMFLDGEVVGAGTGRGGSFVEAHASTVTTARGGGKGATGFGFEGELDAKTLGLELIAENLEAWDNDITDGASLVVDLDCDAGATLVGVEGAREALVIGLGSDGAGIGVSAFVAGAALSDGREATFASVNVTAHGVFWGTVAGRATIGSPDGPTTWEIRDAHIGPTHAGGPGRWSATYDAGATAGLFGTAVIAIGGFAPHPDLAAFEATLR